MIHTFFIAPLVDSCGTQCQALSLYFGCAPLFCVEHPVQAAPSALAAKVSLMDRTSSVFILEHMSIFL
jgi:hypothetical protein